MISCKLLIDLPLVTSNIKNGYGTAEQFIKNINGLKPGERYHNHLSADIDTANAVDQRYDKPMMLKI